MTSYSAYAAGLITSPSLSETHHLQQVQHLLMKYINHVIKLQIASEKQTKDTPAHRSKDIITIVPILSAVSCVAMNSIPILNL